MMMTNDDLRALADALSVPHRDLATVDVIRAADYLRAQADAQPVAWRSKIEGKTKDYWIIQQSEWLAREQPAWEPLYSRAQQMEPAMSNESHPAPAAPQSPSDASHIYRPTSDAAQPQANLSEFTRRPSVGALIRAWEREDAQAEPKREPLSEATALIEWPESAKWKNRAAPEGIERSCMAEPKREPLSDEQIGEIQRAAYERAAQECIETAAELRRCADGCTDGRYDWKADGAADCADAIRALGRQHD